MPVDLLAERDEEPVDLLAEELTMPSVAKRFDEMTDPDQIVAEAIRSTQPKIGKRRATWKEFSTQMPFYGPKGRLPDDVELTAPQAELLAFSGHVDKAGHGLQQNIANLFGADAWNAKNDIAARANQASTNRAYSDNPEAAKGGGLLGDMAAMLPLEPLAASGILGTAGSAGIWGANQYRQPGESMALNAAIPAAIPLAIKGITTGVGATAKALAKRFLGMPKDEIIKDLLQIEGVTPEYQQKVLNEMRERTNAANKIGVNLTPGEAAGSPRIAQEQATVGRTKVGAGKLEEHYRGEGGRYDQENNAVSDFFKKLGVKAKDVSADTARKIRDVALGIIKEQEQARKKLSKPIYKKAYQDIVPKKEADVLFKDEVIYDAAQKLDKNPVWRERLKQVNKNSIEYWDLIKKSIDDKIGVARNSGNKELAAALQSTKDKLIRVTDKYSPMYKKARQVYGSESEVLAELNSTNLSKIANLPDRSLKSVSKLLFDKAEIDPKTLNTIRTSLLKNDKQTYYDALAQNMKSAMDTSARSATKREAPAFYTNILKNDDTYNLYADALKHNPPALRRLEYMKKTFQELMGDYTPKTASGLEKAGMTNPRDILKGIALKLFKGGKYDETAVAFMTDPKWFDQAERILSQKEGPKKTAAFLSLLSKISSSKSLEHVNNNEENE